MTSSAGSLTPPPLTQAELQRAFDLAPVALVVADPEGRLVLANDAASGLLNGGARLCRFVTDFFHPDDAERLRATFDAPRTPAGGAVYRLRGANAPAVRVTLAPLVENERALMLMALSASPADTTLKLQRAAMSDVAHRARNLVTIIEVMARQFLKRGADPDAFEATFAPRIGGLMTSLNLAAEAAPHGVMLELLLQRQLRGFAPPTDGRLQMRGPELRLSDAAAQNIGMAIFELGDNASRHGAWSNRDGRVDIEWRRHEADGGRRFEIIWRESPGIADPISTLSGFGRMICEEMAAYALGGDAVLTISAEGAVWRLDAPRAAVEAGIESD